MRIGVVGSGVSGLTAAYLLSKRHEVTLFEKDARLGGHANTVDVATGSGSIPIDTGFIVHNKRTYPQLLKLFAELGVQTQPSEMSMSVRCEGCGLEYAGSKGIAGLFPSLDNLRRPAYIKMLAEIKRFHRHGRSLLQGGNPQLTVGAMLEEGDYSDYFRQHFLLPLIGAVWSSSQDVAGEYPAEYLMRFLDNHGMLAIGSSPEWRTVVRGSREYVDKVAAAIGDVKVAAEVVGVIRDPSGVSVIAAPGDEFRFDKLVVATHPDQALKLLDDASDDENRILGAWTYSANETVLHTDDSVLPRKDEARSSWNYLMDGCGADGAQVRITYDLTRLMSLGTTERYCVTLNQTDRIDPSKVIMSTVYDHPVYTLESLRAQRELSDLQGRDHTYFAGAYHGWGFHEDGCRSGVEVARLLGVEW